MHDKSIMEKRRMSKSYRLELQTPVLMPKILPEVCCRVEAVCYRVEAICCSSDHEEICNRSTIREDKLVVSYT